MQLHKPLSKLTPPKLGCSTPLGVRNRSLFVLRQQCRQKCVGVVSPRRGFGSLSQHSGKTTGVFPLVSVGSGHFSNTGKDTMKKPVYFASIAGVSWVCQINQRGHDRRRWLVCLCIHCKRRKYSKTARPRTEVVYQTKSDKSCLLALISTVSSSTPETLREEAGGRVKLAELELEILMDVPSMFSACSLSS